MKKFVVMYVRLWEADGELQIDGPFHAGQVNDDDEMRALIKEINADQERPPGTIMPKKFDARLPLTDVYRAASKSFLAMFEDMEVAYEVTNRKRRKS